ncbi:MAG TPA: ribonuclease HI family protein [Candidatus Babeliales bacterium]|nr:ribonuclease HI family protein [Candidatus Babeliales bacterium]
MSIKQLNFFTNTMAELETKQVSMWKMFVDGASRNNPGPSGAGIYIEKDGILEIKEGYYLGIKTNNQAEYLALLLGFFILVEHINRGDTIQIVSDSQLLVRQLMGVYRVKQPHLQPLHSICKEMMCQLGASIVHVLRHENSEADAMANYGVDGKVFPPKHYIALLKHHGILL